MSFLHKKKYKRKKNSFFLLPSLSLTLTPILRLLKHADLLPPTTVVRVKTTQVKPQLRLNHCNSEPAPSDAGITRRAASAARSVRSFRLRSGLPSPRWTSSSSALLRGAPWWPDLYRDKSEQLRLKSTNWSCFFLVRTPLFSFGLVPNHQSYNL